MAYTTQYGATTGLRRRPPYVDIINAQAPYLPYYRSLEDEQKRWKKDYGLRQRALKENTALGERQLGLEERRLGMTADYYREMEKQGKTAQKIGWANLGIGAGLGLADLLSPVDYPALMPGDMPNIQKEIKSGIWDLVGIGKPEEGFKVSDIPAYEGDYGFDVSDIPIVGKPLNWLWDVGKDIYEDTIGGWIEDLFS